MNLEIFSYTTVTRTQGNIERKSLWKREYSLHICGGGTSIPCTGKVLFLLISSYTHPCEWRLFSESYFTKQQVTPVVVFSSLLCSWSEWWIQVSYFHLSFILFYFHHLCEFRGGGNWGRAHSLNPDDSFGSIFPCSMKIHVDSN